MRVFRQFYLMAAAFLLGFGGVQQAAATTTVATVAAMQALNPTAGDAIVQSYASANDGGGGYFIYTASTVSSPENCINFASTFGGTPTGTWVRQLNGERFTVDMCGASNGYPANTPFDHAFNYCGSHQLPLYIPGKTYYFIGTLTPPVTCNFFGAGGNTGGGGNNGSTILSWSGATGTTVAMSIVGSGAFPHGPTFGGFMLYGYTGVTTGLYVNNVSVVEANDITAMLFDGPGILWGTTQQTSLSNAVLIIDGNATRGALEIDGQAGHQGTTLSLRDIRVESNAAATCGMTIDRYSVVSLIGGDSEGVGTGICVASKPEGTYPVQNLSIQSFDTEDLDNNCMTFGTGWTGSAGFAVQGIQIDNNSCGSRGGGYVVTETKNFTAASNYIHAQGAFTYAFAFSGTNTNAQIGTHPDVLLGGYIYYGGGAALGATPDVPWNATEDFAIAAASLPACSIDVKGQTRQIKDLASAPAYRATITTGSGGGSIFATVTCNGSAWLAGG